MQVYRTNVPGEHVFSLPFYGDGGLPVPKMRMYCIELPDVQSGDILLCMEEHVVSGRVRFPGKKAFTAAQLRFGDYFNFWDGTVPMGSANGFDVTPDNPYAVFSKHCIYVVPIGYTGTQYVSVVGWASSEDATAGDSLELVNGYGHLHILRLAA